MSDTANLLSPVQRDTLANGYPSRTVLEVAPLAGEPSSPGRRAVRVTLSGGWIVDVGQYGAVLREARECRSCGAELPPGPSQHALACPWRGGNDPRRDRIATGAMLALKDAGATVVNAPDRGVIHGPVDRSGIAPATRIMQRERYARRSWAHDEIGAVPHTAHEPLPVHGPELPDHDPRYAAHRRFVRSCPCGTVETGFPHEWHRQGECERYGPDPAADREPPRPWDCPVCGALHASALAGCRACGAGCA